MEALPLYTLSRIDFDHYYGARTLHCWPHLAAAAACCFSAAAAFIDATTCCRRRCHCHKHQNAIITTHSHTLLAVPPLLPSPYLQQANSAERRVRIGQPAVSLLLPHATPSSAGRSSTACTMQLTSITFATRPLPPPNDCLGSLPPGRPDRARQLARAAF